MRQRHIFHVDRRRAGRRWLAWLMLGFVLAWAATAIWHTTKPLPKGISESGPLRPLVNARFLADFSSTNADGSRTVDQQIFDRIFGHISRARHLIVLDMFLFNDFAVVESVDAKESETDGASAGRVQSGLRPLSTELTEALLQRKRERPELRVIFITDPINTLYGSFELEQIRRLREFGIDVVITDLKPLRDSNPLWSGFWRLCCSWLGNDPGSGWLPNPMGDTPITLRGLLALPNFKANHRKTLVADTPVGWVGLVTSANPHDGSSAHSNVAIEFHGPAAFDLLSTERAIPAFSSSELTWPSVAVSSTELSGAVSAVQVLTESKIRDAVLAALDSADAGDRVDLGMFYLSHRAIIGGLLSAASRGAEVRVLLDANRDAFGREKNGVPNRPVAAELVAGGIDVRWCNTSGEQCHDKALLLQRRDGSAELIAGSANFTRRNLDDLNLETNARVVATIDQPLIKAAVIWFERRWMNAGGRYSVDYEAYADDSLWKRFLYRVMEFSGLSTF